MKLMNFMNGKKTFQLKNCSSFELKMTPINFFVCRVNNQPRFPRMTKNHVHQFYHSCYYNKDETKKAFQKYVEVW